MVLFAKNPLEIHGCECSHFDEVCDVRNMCGSCVHYITSQPFLTHNYVILSYKISLKLHFWYLRCV